MTPNTIEFQTTGIDTGRWVMRITADRRIEVNEDVEVTEAAQKVLEAMRYLLLQQKRTWVGLTDVDAVELWQLTRHDIVEFARAIEAKLKEKNT
jgi:hypothetical protein